MAETKSKTETTQGDVKTFSRPADKYIWGVYLGLLIISIIESYSASSFEVRADNVFAPLIRHLMTLGIGLLVTYYVSQLNYRWLLPLTPVFVLISLVISIAVFAFGFGANNATRSIEVLGFQLQSSEFIKLSAVAVIALVASKAQDAYNKLSNKGVIIIAISVGIFGGMLFRDGLSNTAILMGVSICMMLLGGIRFKSLFLVLAIYMALGSGALLLHNALKDSRNREAAELAELKREEAMARGEFVPAEESKGTLKHAGTWQSRVKQWLKDQSLYDDELTDDNRQAFFSRMAQGQGGLIGNGPGNCPVASQLPLANIDYVYSVVVSDLGYVGGIVVLLLYMSLLFRAGRIASRCRRIYPAMIIIGMAVFIVFQALYHIAINTGLFPVSGQPLPMISKGGTSIVISSLAFGIMLSVSRTAAMSSSREENQAEKESLPEDLQAENPGMLK